MSYTTSFYYKFGSDELAKVDDKVKSVSILKVLKAYDWEDEARDKSITEEEVIEDWLEYLTNDWGNYQSYDNLDLLMKIAQQFVIDGLTSRIDVTFEWDGEEAGDYTKNKYVVSKINNEIKITRELVITTTDIVIVNPKNGFYRDYD